MHQQYTQVDMDKGLEMELCQQKAVLLCAGTNLSRQAYPCLRR